MAVAGFFHRTNNRVESWHSTLKQKLPAHPNMFVLINALKTMEAGTKLIIMKADIGETPPPRKLAYRKLEEKLQNLHLQHRTGAIHTDTLLRQAA